MVVMMSRPECHLCDAARQIMQRVQAEIEFTLSEVDVDSDPDLAERYGADIPVVFVDGEEVARHRVEPEGFRLALRGGFGP